MAITEIFETLLFLLCSSISAKHSIRNMKIIGDKDRVVVPF